MDTQTRHALKHNALIDTAKTGMDWLQENKKAVLLFTVVVFVTLVVGIGSVVLYQNRQDQSQRDFGLAMETYLTPIAQPTDPPGAKTFPSPIARATKANAEFLEVANRYPMTSAGKNAEYFVGLTYMAMGRNADAERALHQVMDHGNRNLVALAQMALAGIDKQTGRDSDAIQIYRNLVAHPTVSVPVGESELALAAMYEKTNPQQAKQLYAHIKDTEKDTEASSIAEKKLAQLN